jgi:hypothetical protein
MQVRIVEARDHRMPFEIDDLRSLGGKAHDLPSLADALRMLKDQADRTPSPQWVRVVGGWSEFQFSTLRGSDAGENR